MSADKSSENTPAKDGKPKIEKPDGMQAATLEFLGGLDEFKRRHLLSQLPYERVPEVLKELGYKSPVRGKNKELAAFLAALDAYKEQHARLFPNWSEVFSVVMEMGYLRDSKAA